MDNTQRPRWNHAEVKTLSVMRHADELIRWYRERNGETEVPDKEVIAGAIIAVIEGADAYGAARYLDDVYGWPVDERLLSHLSGIFFSLERITQEEIKKWVVKTGTRFPAAPREVVRFRLGTVEGWAHIHEVIASEARAVAYVGKRVVVLEAEDVIGVVKVVK